MKINYVVIDHEPLCHAFITKQKIRRTNPRRLHHIAQFTADIRHVAGGGALHPVADGLYRIEQIDCSSPIEWNEIVNMQQQDSKLKTLLK